MMSYLNKFIMYPSLVYGSALEYVGMRQWYTRIDEHCILGAMPLERNYKALIEQERIKAILTMNEDHELAYGIPRDEWQQHGVELKQMPVVDLVGVADLAQINECVEYINKHKRLNQTVYVHCKAGRYRSALIVGCYLINSKNMSPMQAVEFIEQRRPFVLLRKPRQLEALNEYYYHHRSSHKSSSQRE